MTLEHWQDIEGFNRLYQISHLGRVWSLRNKKILKTHLCHDGYERVTLSFKGKKTTCKIHRLTLKHFSYAFNENPVNHKDLDRSHNLVTNLESVTHANNIKHSHAMGKAKRSTKKRTIVAHSNKRPFVRSEYYSSASEAARDTGFNRATIIKCCQGLRESYKNFKWEYM